MTRKCHNQRLLTDPLHLKERNTEHKLKQLKQPALFLVKVIAELETKLRKRAQHKITTTNGSNNKQRFQHPHIILENLRHFITSEADVIEQISYPFRTMYSKGTSDPFRPRY